MYINKHNMKAYRIGTSIILPHVRYVNRSGSDSMMFHAPVASLDGQYQTLGCNKMDVSGLCLGHKMSRKEFLEKYCAGREPETKTVRKIS